MRNVCLLLALLWATTSAAQPANNDLLLRLYDQLQALQQEVQDLRGTIEEQRHAMQRLQAEQRDRYIDVDRRLSALNAGTSPGMPEGGAGISLNDPLQPASPQPQVSGVQGAAPQGPGAANAVPVPIDTFGTGNSPSQAADVLPPSARNPSPGQGTQSAITAAPEGAQMDEQELYRTALNLLLEQNDYDRSIGMFQQYIQRFPQGRLLTNAYYWQGEALILVSRFSEARDVFNRILNDFPSDQKAAGAMLKLGVVYERLGETGLAEQTWQNLPTRYPESATEIREAQNYLSRLRPR